MAFIALRRRDPFSSRRNGGSAAPFARFDFALCFNPVSCAKENGFVAEPCPGEPLQKINSREISRQCAAHYVSATRGAGLPPSSSPDAVRVEKRDGSLQADQLTRHAHVQAGESLRRLWRQARSCFPSSLGPSLLPQSLQGPLSRKIRERPRAHEEVVRLLCSRNGVAPAGSRPACNLTG